MKLKQLFILLLIANSIALFSVVFILSAYQDAIKELENAYKMQHRSLILADELRQSSDDLTRMARTHVITGNDMFKEQFHTVLDIRNGVKPRPKYYNRIYWDFYTLDDAKPILDGKTVALRTLMKEAGFPDEELELLYKSQQESDDLTYLETKAMNAIKGIFQDKDGNYTIKREPDFALARQIMHGEQYHKAKIAIMKPLNEFYKAFETRTQKKVNEAHETVKRMESYLSISVLFLILLFIFSFIFVILYRIIHPIQTLNQGMLSLAKNNMDITLPPKVFMDEVSDMIGAVEVFKQNAIELMASQQQNKRLLDLAGEGIFGLDAKGKFIFVNPTASKLLGYNSNELIGKSINTTIGKHLFQKGSQQKQRLMLEAKEEQTFISKDEKEFPIDYVSTPIYNNETSLLEGSVVVFSDITKRKQYEDRLKKATIEAQNANRSKSLFLTNMSHELRTPLNAILGFASLLKKSENITKLEKENLQTIHNSGKHLLSIINEILEFAKIEAGKITINNQESNFLEVLEEIESMFEERCREKGLDFSFNISQNVPKYVRCDEKRVKQIFINILGNALKFTQKGSIHAYIDYKNSQLEVKIKDTGIGMSKEEQELIFKPFEQLSSSKEKFEGTGLGLAITKELVEKMSGNIKVQSDKNIGSTFEFNISLEKLDSIKETKSIENSNLKKVEGLKEDIKILVADDTKVNRDLLIQILNTYNLKTYEAKDGLEVLQICKEETFDLIFMDILMPNLNGLDTIKKLREDNYYKDIPIIAISANVFEDDKQKAYQAGAKMFITKPFEENQIISALEKFLNLKFFFEEKDEKEEFKLDKSISQRIKQAAIQLDAQTILNLLNEANTNAYTMEHITKLLREYRFDEIENLCSKSL